MNRGQTTRGRARAQRAKLAPPTARPLLKAVDQGDPVTVPPQAVGQVGDRWMGPFIDANAPQLRRLDIRHEVQTEGGVRLVLHPGSRIGAIPLLSPATRKVAAGLLVSPRFRWSSLGAVFQQTGFSVEPALGGAQPVPGSAREVPPWILAAPVLRRLQALLEHERRGFIERRETRASPRGRIDWTAWSTRFVPNAQMDRFPCNFPDPQFDPSLRAQMRWTLKRLRDSLATVGDSLVGRTLVEKALELEARVADGPEERPRLDGNGALGAYVAEAQQAMGWVAEERGLGGSRALDGLAWDLPVDRLWEVWVAGFAASLAPRLGMVVRGRTRHTLNWAGSIQSMRSLIPDTILQGREKTIFIDAKYKAHLALLARKGWDLLANDVREAHRADLHQILAYAALGRTDDVDALLVYPDLGGSPIPPRAVASLPAGARRVRLMLVSLPFGFAGPDAQEQAVQAWRSSLA